jgi:hypothetical protein
VIDSENLVLPKILMDPSIQLDGGFKIPAERFFHHQSRPVIIIVSFVAKTCLSQHLGNRPV